MNSSTVNFNEFKSFCFRGEGSNNLLLGAERRKDGKKIVWRFKKTDSGHIDPNPKANLNNFFYRQHFVVPFIDNSYLLETKVASVDAQDLHHLAKIPSMPANSNVGEFSELFQFPSNTSRFHACCDDNQQHIVYGLEMRDATALLPYQLPSTVSHGPSITVELKPMQGFFSRSPSNNNDVPYCRKCIFQVEKSANTANYAASDLCPLAIYSGDRVRMCSALRSLIRLPHHKLRIFIDGKRIFDDSSILGTDQLEAIIFPDQQKLRKSADIGTFITAISCILAGVCNDQQNPSDFVLKKGSVLRNLLDAQRIDTVPFCQVYESFKQLKPDIQRKLRGRSHWSECSELASFDFLRKDDLRSVVERYLLGVTFAHCSIMLNLQMVDSDDAAMLSSCGGDGRVRIGGLDGNPLDFIYSARIVDFDPKSAHNLEEKYRRYLDGTSIISAMPGIRKPCIMP